MDNKNPINVSEVGTLWLKYQEKTLILRVLEYFIAKADDQQAINIMGGLFFFPKTNDVMRLPS